MMEKKKWGRGRKIIGNDGNMMENDGNYDKKI